MSLIYRSGNSRLPGDGYFEVRKREPPFELSSTVAESCKDLPIKLQPTSVSKREVMATLLMNVNLSPNSETLKDCFIPMSSDQLKEIIQHQNLPQPKL